MELKRANVYVGYEFNRKTLVNRKKLFYEVKNLCLTKQNRKIISRESEAFNKRMQTRQSNLFRSFEFWFRISNKVSDTVVFKTLYDSKM